MNITNKQHCKASFEHSARGAQSTVARRREIASLVADRLAVGGVEAITVCCMMYYYITYYHAILYYDTLYYNRPLCKVVCSLCTA